MLLTLRMANKSRTEKQKPRLVIYPTTPELKAARVLAEQGGMKTASQWLAVEFRKILARVAQ